MLRARYDEDLFRDSTMTFGEHLEDLRKCLFRAVVGLMIGVIAGFFVGKYVVEFIQEPLKGALEKHLVDSAKRNLHKDIEDLQQGGQAVAWDEARTEQAVASGFLPDIIYVPNTTPAEAVTGASQQGEASEPVASAVIENDVVKAGLKPLLVFHRLANDRRLKPTALNAHEVFMIWLKASLLVGVVISSPWIFIQLWSFVAAGLYPHEKRYVHMYLPFSIGLFLLGVAVAFYVAFPLILTFLFGFNRDLGIEIDPRISEWLSFVMMLPLGFGVAFQLPLVMLFANRIGIVSVEQYLSYWRVAVLVIFAIAALLTPPDPWSMSLLALPLTLLYFGGIALCQWLPRGPGLLPVDD